MRSYNICLTLEQDFLNGLITAFKPGFVALYIYAVFFPLEMRILKKFILSNFFHRFAKKSCGFFIHGVQFVLKDVLLCMGCRWFSANSGMWFPHFVGIEIRGRGSWPYSW